MLNIDRLIKHANSQTGGHNLNTGGENRAGFHVCLRQPETLELIMKELSDQWVPTENIVFLSGDLCRKELMVEIEGNQWI